mgnify:FL=1
MNETLNKPIIVPWDYSDKAECALIHAIDFSKILSKEIVLVHIVKKESEVAINVEKLNSKAEEINQKYGVRPQVIVKQGNIFSEIKSVMEDCDAQMAIMGTHGMKGLQKFTGSWALKVITGSKAPFIVVQDMPSEADVQKVVLPLDFKLEEREKLVWAHFIASTFKCKFYLCYIESTDPQVTKRTAGNLRAAISYLENKGINYQLHRLDAKEGLATATVNFAKKIGSGLIIIMTTKNIRFQDYVLGAAEQQIIANSAKIPVMCVNPRPDL